MPELLLKSMESCLFTREFQSTIKKGGSRKKIQPNKQKPHTQTTDCKLLISIKRLFFSIMAKLILLQNKIEVVITTTALLLFFGPKVSLKVLGW